MTCIQVCLTHHRPPSSLIRRAAPGLAGSWRRRAGVGASGPLPAKKGDCPEAGAGRQQGLRSSSLPVPRTRGGGGSGSAGRRPQPSSHAWESSKSSGFGDRPGLGSNLSFPTMWLMALDRWLLSLNFRYPHLEDGVSLKLLQGLTKGTQIKHLVRSLVHSRY